MNSPRTIETILEPFGLEKSIRYDLSRIQTVLKLTGSPEAKLKTIVVAGTNGKGTTALFLSGGLSSLGFKVATFLSPHLQSVTERFLSNLIPVPKAELDRLADKYAEIGLENKLSYFEFLTLLFFHWQATQQADYVVLEVGLGGRLDATNVTNPIACVLTQIDWDHQEYLGDTLEKILMEKMGISRPGVPLFTSESRLELLKKMALSHSPLFTCITGRTGKEKNLHLSLQTLTHLFPEAPLEKLRAGCELAINPGRFETVQNRPRVILSGDHNPAGIEDLILMARSEELTGQTTVLCAFSLDKPYPQMWRRLQEHFPKMFISRMRRHPETLPHDYRALGEWVEKPKQWIQNFLEKANPDETLVITGSLYFVGEVRSLWSNSATFTL